MDLTWLGYVYIAVTVIVMALASTQVGTYTKRRYVGWGNIIAHGVMSALWFWGYATVGVVH